MLTTRSDFSAMPVCLGFVVNRTFNHKHSGSTVFFFMCPLYEVNTLDILQYYHCLKENEEK
jgi:hypothetical protein